MNSRLRQAGRPVRSLASLLDEGGLQLRQLREQTGEAIAALNKVTVYISRLEVKYEAVSQRLLHEYGFYPDLELDNGF